MQAQREVGQALNSTRDCIEGMGASIFCVSTSFSETQPGASSTAGCLGLVLQDALITHVVPGGPAARAGMEKDQYVLAIDGCPMTAREIQVLFPHFAS